MNLSQKIVHHLILFSAILNRVFTTGKTPSEFLKHDPHSAHYISDISELSIIEYWNSPKVYKK